MKKLVLLMLLTGCSIFQSSETRRFEVERRWLRSTLEDSQKGFAGAHQMAPAYSGEMVFQANTYDGIVAYHRDTGEQLWRRHLHGGANSGIQIVEDRLYFGASDGNFYCLDALSGSIKWSFPTRTENMAAPRVHENKVYFLSGDNLFYSLNAETGRQVWVYDRGTASTDLTIRGGSRPAVYENTVYVGFPDGFLVALNTKDGSLAWERQLNTNPRFKDVDASPVVTRDRIYVGSYDGAVYALSRQAGQVLWRFDEGTHTRVALAKGLVVVSTSTGAVKALDPESGRELWSKNVKKGVPTAAVITGGLVLFGASDGPLEFLEASSGRKVGEYDPGWGSLAEPVVDESARTVYLMSGAGNIHSVRFGWETGINPDPFPRIKRVQ